MSKGSDKRKRNRGKKRAENRNQPLAAEPAVPTVEKEEYGEHSKAERKTKREHAMFWSKIGKFMGHSRTTNWLLVVFTGFLAATASYQYVVMDKQLSTM